MVREICASMLLTALRCLPYSSDLTSCSHTAWYTQYSHAMHTAPRCPSHRVFRIHRRLDAKPCLRLLKVSASTSKSRQPSFDVRASSEPHCNLHTIPSNTAFLPSRPVPACRTTRLRSRRITGETMSPSPIVWPAAHQSQRKHPCHPRGSARAAASCSNL